MNRKIWLWALSALGLGLLSAGCTDECVDNFDCRGAGPNFVCIDKQCVEVRPQQDAGQDAGLEDAGGPPDAGPTDGGGDAGSDGGVKGPQCTLTNPTCDGPFSCTLAADGDAGTCTPLFIGITQELDAGVGGTGVVEHAILVPFNNPAMTTTLGDPATNTRFPRFSGDGTSVVYVQSTAGKGQGQVVTLLRKHLLGGDGGTAGDLTLAEATDAGTLDFIQVEYAPANKVLWTVLGAKNTKDGIQFVSGDGGRVQTAVASGGYGDWFPSGNELAFTNPDIAVHSLGDGGTQSFVTGEAIEPQVSPDGKWIVFLKPNPAITDAYSTGVYTIAANGGTPNAVFPDVAPGGAVPAFDGGIGGMDGGADAGGGGGGGDGGVLGHYGTNASWAGSNQIVFVRVTWFRDPLSGLSKICSAQDSVCGGSRGQEIVFQPIDASGKPAGAPVVHGPGVQPSVSPDGTWLAYLLRSGTGQSELHVVPINQSGMAADGGFVHTFPSVSTTAKESRPRWQPR